MLQSPEPKYSPTAAPANSYTPVKTAAPLMEQATIGRTLVIKGEITGAESLFVDGRVEGTINLPDNRVTIGRNGNVAANVSAKEVVVMGKIQGNVECSDRLDIRSEGSLTGDVITHRISVEEGAILKGGVEVRVPEKKAQPQNQAKAEPLRRWALPRARSNLVVSGRRRIQTVFMNADFRNVQPVLKPFVFTVFAIFILWGSDTERCGIASPLTSTA